MREVGDVTGMTRIDEGGYLSIDHVSITIVLILILPKISIKVFLQLHPLDSF
jgi:hypothetical protein